MPEDTKQRLADTETWLGKEYATIRTGQAAPAILDGIKVEAYGSKMPIPQVSSVGIEDARTLRVSPWDAGMVSAIERAVLDADLGVSVATDSNGLRVIFPELTSERRTQLSKLAKSKLEDARVAVRSTRDEAMKSIEKQEKAGDMSEDEMRSEKEAVQKMVDATNKNLEAMFDKKEAELQQ